MIDADDEQKVKNLKRAIGYLFSVKNVLEYESQIEETAAALFQKLSAVHTVDVFTALQQFQIDFLMKLAFTEHQGYLQADKDPHPISGEGRLAHFHRWQSMPFVEHFYYKTPILRRFFRKSAVPLWMSFGLETMRKRLVGRNSNETANPDLLDKYLEAAEKYHEPELVPTMISSTISAGFDTTAYTSSSMLCLLLNNPQTLAKLRNEIDSAGLSDPPKSHEVDKLEYLAATIREAMRMHPFINVVLERIVPKGGATIGGQWLPGGTVVGCHAGIVGRDKDCFGDDADTFRPKRWLTKDPERKFAMGRGFLGFGGGNRICLGRHLAELEIKKIVSSLLMKFDVRTLFMQQWVKITNTNPLQVSLVDPTTRFDPMDHLTAFPRPIMVTFTERT
jgi:cytochrome P450